MKITFPVCWRRSLLGLLALLALELPALAQGFQTQVRFVDRTNYQRRAWGVATVPFPPGQWMPGQTYVVSGGQGSCSHSARPGPMAPCDSPA